MSANTNPIFIGTAATSIGGTAVTTANTAVDGTGTVISLFTAGTAGAYIRGIRFKAAGTNVASVARIFLNNGSSTSTAANNSLIGELPLSATTASNNAAIGPDFYYPLNMVISPNYVITICYGTAGAAGWLASCEAGNF